MCSMKDTGNKYLAEYHGQIQDKVEELLRERLSGAKANVWYSFRELEYSFPLLCGGLELRHPEARFEDGRFVIQTKLAKDTLNIDEYCDNKW